MRRTSVPRHGTPGPNATEWAEELGQDLTEDIDELGQSSEMIDSTFSTALLYLQARCTVDPRAAELETWEAVVNAMQLGSAIFAASGVSEGTVECRVNRELRNIPALGPSSFADAGNWLTSFWLAVVCRDQKRMTELCEIPLDRLRSPEGAYDEYIYHWVDVLQDVLVAAAGAGGQAHRRD